MANDNRYKVADEDLMKKLSNVSRPLAALAFLQMICTPQKEYGELINELIKIGYIVPNEVPSRK